MSVRGIVIAIIVVVAFVAGITWQRQMATNKAGNAAPAPEAGTMPPPGGETVVAPTEDTHPGVDWTKPARWTEAEPRPMRIATYVIPHASGDAEDAECAVFYFGHGQGGGVQDNLDRWVGQFSNPRDIKRTSRDVGGLKVWRLELGGTYLAPSGPRMESQGSKPNYRLLGGIVEGPVGGVFFKLTGPEKTVKAAAKDFDAMLDSVRKS